MNISLHEFIKTGRFGPIELGQTMEYIMDNFPSPDNISDMNHNTYIWEYSSFEFHFIANELFLLWCDNLTFLGNPNKKQYTLDKWILDKQEIDLLYFCAQLESEDIEYNLTGSFFSSQDQGLPDNVILSIKDADTVVYFENIKETATCIQEYEIVAIGSTKFKHKYKVYPL